jgi:hypothetical protein
MKCVDLIQKLVYLRLLCEVTFLLSWYKDLFEDVANSLTYKFLGAGHGGRGGGSSDNMFTGAPYGEIFEPIDLGCSGGKSSVSGNGGRGGGTIYLNVTKELQNDGEISCNGEPGTGSSGGGSGGSILIDVNNIKVMDAITLLLCFSIGPK